LNYKTRKETGVTIWDQMEIPHIDGQNMVTLKEIHHYRNYPLQTDIKYHWNLSVIYHQQV